MNDFYSSPIRRRVIGRVLRGPVGFDQPVLLRAGAPDGLSGAGILEQTHFLPFNFGKNCGII